VVVVVVVVVVGTGTDAVRVIDRSALPLCDAVCEATGVRDRGTEWDALRERAGVSDRDTDTERSAVPDRDGAIDSDGEIDAEGSAVPDGVGITVPGDVIVSVSGTVALVKLGVTGSDAVIDGSALSLREPVTESSSVAVAVSGTVRDVSVAVIGSDSVCGTDLDGEREYDLDRGRDSDRVTDAVSSSDAVAVWLAVTDFHVKFLVLVTVKDMGVMGRDAVSDRQRLWLQKRHFTRVNTSDGTDAARNASPIVTADSGTVTAHGATEVIALAPDQHASSVHCVTWTSRVPDDVAGRAGAATHVPLAGHVRQQRRTRIDTPAADEAERRSMEMRVEGAVTVAVVTATRASCTTPLSVAMPTPGT
jgi:hypothetical protein